MGGQGVGGLGVNGGVLAGLAVQNLNILDPAVAGHLHEVTSVVQLHGGGDGGVHGVLDAGNLQEAAALRHAGLHGAQLQSVQDLLAGNLHQAGQVAEGMDSDDVAVGDVAGGNIVADAAAVDKADVSAQQHAVGVGAQVAQVGLGGADGPLAGVGIVDGQIHGGGGDDFFRLGFILSLNTINEGLGGGVGLRGGGHISQSHQLGGHGAVGSDDQLAHGLSLGAGLAQEHVLAVGILHGLGGLGGVGVAVQHHVDAGGVGNDLGGHPGRTLGVLTQVSQGHHILGASLAGGIHGVLHLVIEGLAVLVLAEAIDVLALVVLEVGGGGLGQGLGSGDAHIGHVHIAVGDHGVGLQNGLAVGVHKVTADIGVLSLVLGDVQEGIHAEIKLMVAGDGNVVAHVVHDVHDPAALGQGTQDAALDGVAVVHQGDVVGAVFGFHLSLIGGDGGIGHTVVAGAVDVVGVENHNAVIRGSGGLSRCGHGGDAETAGHGQGQEQRQELACVFSHETFHLSFRALPEGTFSAGWMEPERIRST